MDKTPKIKKGKYVSKGWGHELHIENNEDYCGKLLVFNKGKQKGKLKFTWINPKEANNHEDILKEGDIVTIYQGIAHQLEAIEDSIIFETSTQDKIEDSYRVWKGDSQK